MNPFSRTIASLNASAVSLMQQEKYEKSFRMLRNAIQVMRQLAETGNRSNVKNSSPPAATYESSNKRLYHSVPVLVPPSFNSGMFPFFNRALLINVDSDEFVALSEEGISHRLVAVLLYNCGLLHHRCAIKTGGSGELSKALTFYERAFASLSGIYDDLRNTDSLLVLALLNNMGQIRASNLDRREACRCLHMLTRFFAESGGKTLIEEESLFFYITTFIFSEQPLTASPAA